MTDNDRIKAVQNTIFEIFQDVIRICDKEKIDYFIVAGTALGAVRHGGFIPWDDDLDIGMTRENYNRFLSVANDKLNSSLFLQTYQTDSQSPFYFAKVRKNGTKFVEKYARKLDMHQGIYIDIFPYDNVPNDTRIKKKHYKKVRNLSKLYISKCTAGTSRPQKSAIGLIGSFIRAVLHILLLPVPKKALYNSLDKLLQKYNDSNTEFMCYSALPLIEISTENILNPDEIIFEGTKVKCPQNITEHLKHNFGDYMILPDEDQRVGHIPHILEF